ncbi:MAG: ComEC/Rec2 family competence protein [Muribaculaceae bacterium]|nr:ComEC/Rec2 family competence protein [Muribaculaceae bacterium]
MNLSLYPLLPVTIAFLAGIILECCGGGMWGLMLSILTGIILFALRRPFLAVCCLSFGLGILDVMVNAPHTPTDFLESSNHFSGRILERQELDGSLRLIVRVDSCNEHRCQSFLTKILIPGVSPDCDETDRMKFKGSLHELVFEPDLPGQKDYDLQQRRQGVTTQMTLSPDSIVSLSESKGIYPMMRRSRHELSRIIAYSPISSSTSGFLIATLTGDRKLLLPEAKEFFKTSGLSHILALSGLHVGIILICILVLLSPLTLTGHRILRMVITIPALWGFAFMTGLSPSVTRAVIMTTVVLITMMLERERAPINALCIALVAMLMIDPLSVYSVGFQLSFMAVISILVLYRPLTTLPVKHPFLKAVLSYVAVSLAATAGTSILVAFHFGYLTLWTIPANVICSFLLPPLIGGGALLTLLSSVGIESEILGKVIDFLYITLEDIASWFAALPVNTLDLPTLSWAAVLMYLVILSFFAIWIYNRRRIWLYASSITMLTGIILINIPEAEAAENVEIYVVRHKDATTILTRDGKKMQGFSTVRPSGIDDVRERSERLYSRYMKSHNVDSIPFTHISEPTGFEANGRRLIVTSRMLDSESDRPTDILIVCRGFKGDIVSLANNLRADSVVISTDMHHSLRDKYLIRLSEAGIPSRSLKEAPVIVK